VHISPEIQPWDGVPRLHNWLATVLGKDNTAPLSKHGEALLLNIAKRMRGKPLTQERIIVFCGQQGLRKSTLLRVLAGEHYSDDAATGSESAPSIWLKEINEINLMTASELASLKSYLTSQKAKQGKIPVYVGTASTTQVRDLQRRFVAIHITQPPNIKWLSKNRDQLLAEAAEKVGT
jgi:predicted P-loop ATPase